MESSVEDTPLLETETVVELVTKEEEFIEKTVETAETVLAEEGSSSSCDATVGTEEDDEENRPSQTDRSSDGSDSGLGPDDEARSSNDSSQASSSSSAEASPLPRSPLPLTVMPSRSSLKRCLFEPSTCDATDAPLPKKKRGITFDSVTVYYFSRAQGFTCVPSQGGSTLGMTSEHTHSQTFTLSEHALEQRKHHRQMMLQMRNERLEEAESLGAVLTSQPTSSSSEDSESDDDVSSEMSDNDLDYDNYYCLQPIPTRQRRGMLRSAGVRKIDSMEKDECRDIRISRESCGCACKDYCDPDTCSCARGGIKCQVDRMSFPCGCTRDGCANGAGRIEFNIERVRTHFIQTLMRLEMEKKQDAEQERQKQQEMWTNGTIELPSASGLLSKQHDKGPHHISLSPNMESCIRSGNFTTLHYEQQQHQLHHQQQLQSVARSDQLLEMYPFREQQQGQITTEENQNFTSQNQENEKLMQHHYFAFTTATNNFPQTFTSSTLEFDSTSSYNPTRFHHHDQPDYSQQNLFTNNFSTNCTSNTSTAVNFHYDYQQTFKSNDFCNQIAYTTATSTNTHYDQRPDDNNVSKYTNLHTVTPTKLEPFSEILNATQYSSTYDNVNNSTTTTTTNLYLPTTSYATCEEEHLQLPANNNTATIVRPTSTPNINPSTTLHEECVENFGEIIKKSMVETVSA